MRLHRLEVEGFGPFRSRQVVDFDAFADDGIFLIAGRTGAGKSSILDAVCFGLYGGVPRYESGEKRLRSDHCKPDDLSEVIVEFSTPAGRYRITRTPEYQRPAKRGGGMTKQAAGAALDEWTEAGWVGRAARAVDVGNDLDEILQLSREQFLQVILLAQNRFSEFLLAGSKDRQTLLRRLFGTERFEVVQSRFDDRRRSAEQALGARLATVTARVEEAERLVTDAALWGGAAAEADQPAGSDALELDPPAPPVPGEVRESGRPVSRPELTTDERLEDLRRAKARADYRAERRAADRDDAAKRSAEADAALGATRDERRAQQERNRARAAMERLDAEEPQILAARTELERARAAEALRATISASRRADTALAAAADAEANARVHWDALAIDLAVPPSADRAQGMPGAGAPEPEISAALLETWASERTKESGAWERARELEKDEPALAAELHAAQDRVEAASARSEAGEAERAALPDRIAATTTERDEARRSADRAADLLTAREAAASRLAAAREAARLEPEIEAADRALTEATTAHAERQSALARLRQRRADGMAGELASALADGAACPVCGAHEHPAPAEHSDPVSAADIEEAERRRDAAARREREASEKVAALGADLAAAMGRADDRDVERAEDELKAAEAAHALSVAAAETLKALEAQLRDLASRLERLERDRVEDAAALAAAREEQVLLAQRHAETQRLVAEARGPFPTVAERMAEATAHVAAARTLAGALEESTRRAASAAEAKDELQAALAASAFEDAAAAEQALRSSAAREALETRISDHAVQREKERAILFDLELRTLPEDPIDVTPAEQAAADARAAWTAAVDEASRAEGAAERLGGLIDSAASEHARTAEEAAEFEVLRGLADTIAGRGANTRKMTLETFVLAAELEEIVEAANRRLGDMSTGRYQLRHSDALAARGAASGLGIVVFDAFTGQTRPAQSLSGGETFLSSLALALGLAEVVTARAGGIRLDTLFIDEGFGSLDGDTLDVAMRTLDELRQGGRTVGVISHVEAMQEQIPAQLTVRATAQGPSIIETR